MTAEYADPQWVDCSPAQGAGEDDDVPEYSEAFAAMILAEDAKGNVEKIAAEDLLAELDRMIALARGSLH